jgi:hypothetical protein
LLDEDDDNDHSSDSPFLLHETGRVRGNLTEFLDVFSYVETDLAAWTTGKGRKRTTPPKDALLAILTLAEALPDT